jgi:putative hydrolase of the HAD superfamily
MVHLQARGPNPHTTPNEAVMNASFKNGVGRQYRALLLDFGSVIQKSFFETRADIEKLLHLPPGTLGWAGPFDPGSDPLWQRVVSGTFSERDYWNQRARELGSLIGEDWTIQNFCHKHNELPSAVILRPEILTLITDVKQAGLKFGILTNELELFHGKDWVLTIPFADKIDVIVDATHTHILKPDPGAYALALEALGLSADKVIFVDDQPRNVAGGSAVGIRSLHFDITNPLQSIAQVRLAAGL